MRIRRTLSLAVILTALAVSALAADVSGNWTSDVDTPMGVITYTYDFKVDGTTLTGTAATDMATTEIQNGKVEGDEISFLEVLNFDGQEIRIEYKGKVSGDEIRFNRSVGDFGSQETVAKRVK